MRFDLEEVMALTGAKVLRWTGPRTGLRPVVRNFDLPPGALVFPRYGAWTAPGALEALAAAGAAGVVLPATAQRAAETDSSLGPTDPRAGLGLLSAADPYRAARLLAAEARRRTAGPVVAVTGSSGKSTTTAYLASIFAQRYRVSETKNNNNLFPDAVELLLGLEGGTEQAAVLEMGFGWRGDIGRMGRLVEPDAAVITNVTPHHLAGSGGSWRTLVNEKGQLGLSVLPGGLLVLRADDPATRLLRRWPYRCRVLTFGATAGADAACYDVTATETGVSFALRLGRAELRCALRSSNPAQATNAAAAGLMAAWFGFSRQEIRDGLETVPALPGRFSVHRLGRGLTVIDDSFNASFDAMTTGLAAAAGLAAGRRKVAVLSGIPELGARVVQVHLEIGRCVAAASYDRLLLLGADERTAAIREGALRGGMDPAHVLTVPAEGLPATLLRLAGPRTLVYAKGNHAAHLGRQLRAFCRRAAAAGRPQRSADPPGV